MKKRLLSLIVGLLFISGFAMAGNIAQQDASSKTSQCKADQSININYYINTSYTRYPSDIFANTSDDSFISPSNSSVQIWRNGVIGGCSDWYRSSNVVKSTDIDGAVVLQNGDGCVFTKPNYLKVGNNATKVDAQIHYTIGYYEKGGRFSPTMTSRFYYKHTDTSPWQCYPNGNVVSDTSSCTPVKVHYRNNIKLHTGECINYRIFRCGDGLVNSPYGSSYTNGTFTEQCDPNDPTQAGWNNNGYTCNASCQLVIAQPVQPDLTIVKEQISTGTMQAGSTVAYKITVKNIGSGPATGVTIYDVLPTELQYIASSINITPSSTYLFTTGTVQVGGTSRTYIKYYNITLSANGTAIVYLTGKVKNGYTFDTLTNCASVSGNNIMPEEDCVTVTPQLQPDLTIVKEQISTGTMQAGSTVAYKITVKNIGSGPATGVTIYDVLPTELQYIASSINITPSSTYLFTTGTVQVGGTSRTYIKYYNIALSANGTAIVYLTGKVKNGYTFDTLTNCASVSGNNIMPEEDCVTVTPPSQSTPSCTITLSSNDITLGDSVMVNYQISGSFNSPTSMYINPNLLGGSAFPYTIYCDTSNDCQFTQGSVGIAGTSIPNTGTYTFWITGHSTNGDFYCKARLKVSAPTRPESTSCKISLSSNNITLGDPVVVNYQIIGGFANPTTMNVNPLLNPGIFPYNIHQQQGSVNIPGTSIPSIGTYIFTITGYSTNGKDFSCTTVLKVNDNNPPITGHGNVSIQKILESVGPFSVGDEIRYKIVAENHGDATVMDSIRDIMPYSVDYLTSSIMFVPDTYQNYTFSTGIYDGSFAFRYDNLSIAPGQKVIIYLTGRINSNYIDEATMGQVNSTFSHFYDGDDCMGYWTNAAMMGNYEDITKNCAYTYTDGTGENGSGTVTGSCVIFPKPSLIKYQSVRNMNFTRDQLVVAKGETITYKVVFGNEYGATMGNVTLFDVLPTCVEYIDSSVHGISGYGFSTATSSSGNTLIYYTGFSLGSGQYGYMIVTGKISNSASCQNAEIYRNYAYLIYSGGYLRSDVVAKRPDVLLTKGGDGPHYNLSQPNTFFITVTNNSNDTIYDVVLSEVDSWPTFNGCVNYIDWKGSNFTKDSNALIWRYNGNLQPGESINLTISGSIGGEASCVRDYVNTVVLTYKDGAGYSYTLDAIYPFDVDTGESAVLDKTVDEHKVTSEDIVTYTITYQNVGNVDRKTGYTLTDKWPSDVLTYLSSNCSSIATCSETVNGSDIVFTFNSALHPGESGTLILKGKVRGPWDGQKLNTVVLDYSTIFDTYTLDDDDYIVYVDDTDKNCGNGILEGKEECDGGYDSYLNWGSGDRFLIINYLDYKHTKLAGDYAGRGYYCTQSCELRKTNDSSYSIPSCLNVDTTISIMENEIFPFWWRIWERDGIEMVNGGKKATSCSKYSTDKNTVINKDTMKCYFAVYDGKSYNQANKEPLYEFNKDCFIDKNSNDDIYFEPFDNNTCAFSWCVDFDKVAARQIINLQSLFGSKRNKDTYGEYKLALEHVTYQYCAEDGIWTDGALYDAVCEVDFALTKPYLMQINTSGTPKATSSDFLNKFYDIAGNRIQTDLSDVIKVNQSSYNINTNVQSQINQFKNKYEKLAVTVNNNLGGGVSSLKKVPNQSIYFVKGNGGNLILSKTDSILSKPFTIFVEGMNVVIDGSVLTNGMVITDKTISFKDSNCTSGGQVVQGIFIAQGGFGSNNSTLNITPDRKWCHWGNLHVKGVLIGSGVNNIMNSKRSQLNSWFQTEIIYRTTNDSGLKSERRNEIIRGASVLIEYNQDVWGKTIPGAEIFTQTLDVYRK